jgi:hypothetical protein
MVILAVFLVVLISSAPLHVDSGYVEPVAIATLTFSSVL